METSAFCYLTTRGRRTGRPHTIEIWFVVIGASAYLMAGGRDRALVVAVDVPGWTSIST